MTRESLAAIFVIFVLAAGFLAAIAWDRARMGKRRREKLREQWGKRPVRIYTQEELSRISRFAKVRGRADFQIDDITWNDLDLDRIFQLLNTCVSSCGEDVLYAMLRAPLFDGDEIGRREEKIRYFASCGGERVRVQEMAAKAQKTPSRSLTDDICALKDAPQRSVLPSVAGGLAVLAAFLLLLVCPVAGMLALLAVLSFNAIRHNREAARIDAYYAGIAGILRLLSAADAFKNYDNPVLAPSLEKIRRAAAGLSAFRRGAFLVTASSGLQDGLDAFVITYLKLFFHLDLIKFYTMVRHVAGHEREIFDLYEAIGELDAWIALASFRKFLPCYAKPEFIRERGQKERPACLEAEDLYHPLLLDPVANTVRMERGILVTGSNASGKSTFLKTVALGAILAQTALSVPARSYRADYFRVLTSMALRDNLSGGESYYIVEIRSLKRILEACRTPDPVLCVVDEVLRGTNTVERIAASSRILRSLARPHILTLAATHDIELSYMLEDCLDNYHFEEEIGNNDIRFLYRLEAGRATSRNAIRLLEMIGYDPQIVKDAQEACAHFEKTGEWR